MRRILEFCHWKARWWDQQADRRSNVSPPLQEGLRAYAAEQAAMERMLARSWESKWRAVRERARTTLDRHAADVADEVGEVGPEVEIELDDVEDGNELDFLEDDD